ncbi:MAG: EAL domain-containing protein [Anaerolineales bacterium]|nr:EAL domain-containing protein [Anaerolineales bacterium]
MSNLNVLMVEDDIVDQMALERHIRQNKLPYLVTTCESITEARVLLQQNSYDVILLDYLPVDGTAFDLLEAASEIVTIILTGQGDEEIAVKAIKQGAADYLPKDLQGNYLDILDQTIHRALDERKNKRELDQYREKLEDMVNARTAELTRINKSLIHEIEVRKCAEEQLQHFAFYDTLTGLANRTLFLDHLESTLQRALRKPDMIFAVLFLDLDNFKLVNDTLGHHQGDALLMETAARIKQCVRSMDTVARLGGDEFVILVEDIHSQEDILHIIRRILRLISDPYDLNGDRILSSCSIGVVLSDGTPRTPLEILQDADIAMYQAKEDGKNCYKIFKKSMRSSVIKRVTMEADLKKAIKEEGFLLYYQPILDLKTGQIRGLEALLRWEHPELGFLAPDSFLPLAEDNGLIQQIDLWVLETACEQTRLWQEKFPFDPPLQICVNLSSQHLYQPDFHRTIKKITSRCGFDPSHLALEITEHSLIKNPDRSSRLLSAIKDLGISIHMDDFGTGYSSLSYLMQYPIDVVKIDRSFILSILKDKRSAALVRAIILLCREMNLPMTAEGIEEEAQLEILRQNGCCYGQGYLFSKPVPAQELDKLLERTYPDNFRLFI